MNTPSLDGIPAILLFAALTLVTFGPFLLFYFAWSAHRSLRRIADAAEHAVYQRDLQTHGAPHGAPESVEQARERIANSAFAR